MEVSKVGDIKGYNNTNGDVAVVRIGNYKELEELFKTKPIITITEAFIYKRVNQEIGDALERRA